MRELLGYVLKGNAVAIEFFEILHSVAHFWDDLIDKDAYVSDDDINGVMWNALVALPRNAFYRQHFDVLNPILVNAIANWQAATGFERSGNKHQKEIAFIARSDYSNLLIQAAYLIGGREWLLTVTPRIRDTWTRGGFDGYLNDLDRERATREGTRDELVRGWYDEETDRYLANGLTVFNASMLAPTEEEHVRRIYELMEPPVGATIVDMGCGVGAVGALLKRVDETLTVYGVTDSKAQADHIRASGAEILVYADFHQTGLPDGLADVVLFNESFGYGNAARLLAEAARILKPGGVLCIRDFTTPTGAVFNASWQFRRHSTAALERAAAAAGLRLRDARQVSGDNSRYMAFIGNDPVMAARYTPPDADLCSVYSYFWRFTLPAGTEDDTQIDA